MPLALLGTQIASKSSLNGLMVELMLGLAIGTWACNVVLVLFILRLGLSQARCALIALAVMTSLVMLVRQPMFFFGLDAPHPQEHFEATEWALICTANLVSFAWISIALLSYWACERPAHAVSAIFPSRFVQDGQRHSKFAVFLVAFVPFAFSVGGTALLAVQYGGFGALAFAVKVGKELEGLYVIRIAASLASILACYGFLGSLREGQNGSRHLTPLSLVYLGMVVLGTAAIFSWGNRYDIGTLLLGFLVTFHFYVRRLRLVEIVVFCVGAAALFQGLKLIRLAAFSDVTGLQLETHSNFWLDISLSLHAVEFDAFLLALRDTGTLFDFRWGKDFYNGLLSWVPRSIYPEKETFHIGGWFRRVYEPWTVNGWPVTVPGSWYINFGAVGIVLGAITTGLVFRAFDTAFSNPRTNAWHAACAPCLAFFTQGSGIAQGSPQDFLLFYLPLYLAAIWIALTSRHFPLPMEWQRRARRGLS